MKEYSLVIFLILIGFSGTVYGQYLGDKVPPNTMYDNEAGETIFPPTYVDFYYSDPRFEKYSVTAENYQYDIPYMISNGTISQIDMDCFNVELSLDVEPSGKQGWITLALPRHLIDSKTTDDKDDDFFVLLDSKEIQRSDIASEKLRLLLIPFSDDVSQVNISGINYPENRGENACNRIHDPPFSYLFSPLKQFNMGIPHNEIACVDDLVLVQKHENSPACVNLKSIPKLLERGWIKESEPTFLSKSLTEWKNMSPAKLHEFSEKYPEDNFNLELGKFLIKHEMKKELKKQNLQNKNDDFVVYPGMSAMAIGFSGVVNATDQNTYFLQGSVLGNRIDNDISVTPLIFYPHILHSLSKTNESDNNNSQKPKPYEKLLDMESKVIISKGSINDIHGRYFVNGEPHDLILNLDKNDVVSFYNNLDIPMRVVVEEKEKINTNNEIKENNSIKNWKTGTIMPQKTGTIKIGNIGQYELQVVMPSPVSEDNSKGSWETVGNVGQITAVSKETQNLTLEEKLEIARPFMFHAHEEIPWYTLSSGHGQYVEMSLPKSIHKMIPDSKEYYEKRAQEWIPFEVPIKIR